MYFDDPEQKKEDWDEPILAHGPKDAWKKCQKLADTFTEQSQSNVELIGVEKASKRSKSRFICKFRSSTDSDDRYST